jgi:hypothetical protein
LLVVWALLNNYPVILVAPIIMLKLYRKSNGVMEYWEAWYSSAEITIHWGQLGKTGRSRELPFEVGVNPDETIKREAKSIRASGFKPLKRGELHQVVIQYKLEGNGRTGDLDKRAEVEELMNECLGWTGLGHCDGGDIGSGEMNIFCFVADTDIAERVIVRELKSKSCLEGALIAERTGNKYKVLWPHDFEGKFSVV